MQNQDRKWRGLPAEAWVLAIGFMAAFAMLPSLYAALSNTVWVASTAIFAVLPLLAGCYRGCATRSASVLVVLCVVFCPLVYLVTDGLAADYERIRDAFFLSTASAAIFLSSNWVARYVGAREWLWAGLASTLLILSSGAACITTWLFVYLE